MIHFIDIIFNILAANKMPREIISIHVGEAGINVGTTLWELYCLEHGINEDGIRKVANDKDDHFLSMFEETGAGKYVPRALMVDLDPNLLGDLKESTSLYDPECLVKGVEDTAGNFARGYYTDGKEISELVSDKLRKIVGKCSNVQGFFITHSMGGGTGSGLTSLILEKIAVDYRKKMRINIPIFPAPHQSISSLETYNTVLMYNCMLDHTDVTYMIGNKSVYDICRNNLDIAQPSYRDLNQLIAHAVGSTTVALRFDGELNVDMNEFQTNLVPFPRLHGMTLGYAPLESRKGVDGIETFDLTTQCFRSSNTLVSYNRNDERCMAISLNYRGSMFTSKEVNHVVQKLKQEHLETLLNGVQLDSKLG